MADNQGEAAEARKNPPERPDLDFGYRLNQIPDERDQIDGVQEGCVGWQGDTLKVESGSLKTVCRMTPDSVREQIVILHRMVQEWEATAKTFKVLVELAAVLLRAYDGNWDKASSEWREAAERWRVRFYKHLDAILLPPEK